MAGSFTRLYKKFRLRGKWMRRKEVFTEKELNV
jgi:hypothetical protein